MAIVGYSDNAFLIKNSWGTDDWGDEGYGWVSFDYHRLFAVEALFLSVGKVDIRDEDMDPDVAFSKNDLFIKSLPFDFNSSFLGTKSKGIDISLVYHGESALPRFDHIEYQAYDAAGNLLDTSFGNTHGIFDGRESGYQATLMDADTSDYSSCYKLVGHFTTLDGVSFTNTYYNIEHRCQEYAPQ